MRPVSLGDRGNEVVDIQTRLQALGYFLGQEGADGHFGPETEKATREFQQKRLLLADGVVGDNTWTELVEAGYTLGDRLLYLRIPYMRGDDVLALQRQLNELGFDSGPENGIFGSETETALTDFQRNAGLNVDGIVGEATVSQLRRIRKVELNSQGKKLPDRLNGYVGKEGLAGLRVSLDPAHGGVDVGGRSGSGLFEKDVNLQLARRLGELLEGAGAEVLLTRPDDRFMGLYERTTLVNNWEAELHLCLHHGHWRGTPPEGCAAYYFANGSYFSEAGQRLAGYLTGSLVKLLGRQEFGTIGRNYACLREPQGLAVMVEAGILSHPVAGRRVSPGEEIEREAEALFEGVQAYFERR